MANLSLYHYNKKMTIDCGRLYWSHLTKPNDKFCKEGEYCTKVHLSGQEAEDLKKEITQFRDEMLKKYASELKKPISSIDLARLPFKKDVRIDPNDSEKEIDTGDTVFTVRTNASYTNPKTGVVTSFRPVVKDKYEDDVPENTFINNGSKATIGMVARCYQVSSGFGVSLSPTFIVIREFAENAAGSSEHSAQDFGITFEKKPEIKEIADNADF